MNDPDPSPDQPEVTPLTDEDIERLREGLKLVIPRTGDGWAGTTERLIATIDAKDAEIARLTSLWHGAEAAAEAKVDALEADYDDLMESATAYRSKLSIAVAALERIGKTQTIGTPVAQVSTKWDRRIAREALERITGDSGRG